MLKGIKDFTGILTGSQILLMKNNIKFCSKTRTLKEKWSHLT